jgi:hypothetical protein
MSTSNREVTPTFHTPSFPAKAGNYLHTIRKLNFRRHTLFLTAFTKKIIVWEKSGK